MNSDQWAVKPIMDIHQLSSYNFEVPEELIAQEPPKERGTSKLLVLNRSSGEIKHHAFSEIINYLLPGDCLVLNKTKVVPARLYGAKETGGRVEVLFLSFPAAASEALALTRPFLPAGKKILLPDGLTAVVEGKTEQGETILRLSGSSLHDVLERHGHMPLPPYIKREKQGSESIQKLDRERYQTVYAAENGSIAAPTAGLHFTDEILAAIRNKGITIVEVILHVGWGTFRPVTAESITNHQMLPEYYEITMPAAQALTQCYRRKSRIIAVGTTSSRALESAYATHSLNTEPEAALYGKTSLFIYPGYTFKVLTGLLTNFHLPCSTPLFMASAFANRERILASYKEAIEQRYRFFSYGDAMLII